MADITIPFTVPVEHRCFAGHFPGNPIVPGALLLQWMLAMVSSRLEGRDINAVSSAKFSASLKPGDECKLLFDYSSNVNRIRVTCQVSGAVACQAILLLGDCSP